MPQYYLNKIQEAKKKQPKRLDLSRENLTEIPSEVFELEWLEELDLSFNQLTSLPDSLMRLQNLTSLNLSHNQLVSLPEPLTQLQNLTSLNLSDNKLSSISASLVRLQNLTSLNLSGHKLISLPNFFTRLQNLITLNLSHTQLTSLPDSITYIQSLTHLNLSHNQLTSLPKSITRLQNLAILDLSYNQLNFLSEFLTPLKNLKELYLQYNELIDLPYSLGLFKNISKLDLGNNKLTYIPDSIYELYSLEELRLENEYISIEEYGYYQNNEENENKIKEIYPQILQLTNLRRLNLKRNPIQTPPPEVVNKGVMAIKDYFRQLEAEGEEYIYEAKLVIVGEAGAGKTNLAKKIEHPAYKLQPSEPSTEGIDVIEWLFEIPNEEIFKVNIWDFGGQEIYHATHQFFLTKRSLYALVCDTRQEDTDFYYWLNVVELLSNNSPLLIIKNEKQDRQRQIPERQLRGQFSNLKEILATNLATNRGLSHIETQFAHYLSTLPHIGDKLPKTWVKVRNTLERDERHHISLDEYLAICEENGFKQRKDALQLSGYLHDLGVILHFQDDKSSRLYKTVILNPEWGTTAVYRVLDNQKVIANLGQFTQEDLAEIWHEPQYTNMLGELLALMLKFQLCYHIPAQKLYIAPQLLTQNQPDYEWDENNNLILRYTASAFMPKGIITRFILAMHHLISEQKYVWRSGVILQKDKTRAEVIEYFGKREIKIRLSGQYKRDLMTLVTNELDKLYNSFHRLKYEKLIPCNCPTCQGKPEPQFYPFDILRQFARDGQHIQCQRGYLMVNARDLIDDLMRQPEDWALSPKPNPQSSPPSKSQIRQHLKSTYDDVDFETLCLDHFEEVFDQFTQGMRLDAKINLLLAHCRRQPGGLKKLWEIILRECR